jgi:uncharacterized damage-inducible protein DinB
MAINQLLLPEFDQETANTRKVLERVPDDKLDYKPHAKSMTMARLAGHVAELPSWTTETINREVLDLTPDMIPATPASRQEILDKFDSAVKAAREALANVSDEELQKIWTLKWQGSEIFALPRVVVLRNMVMNHMIHHRAQLGVYLRLNDIPVPGMYGPSADDQQTF